jgi:hypothetical protein
MKSFSKNTHSPIEIYQQTLLRHKEVIQKNKYAQELEKKYNKFTHKIKSSADRPNRFNKAPHFWPIYSNVFTEVLRSKLSSVLKPQTPKASTRPNTRETKAKWINRSLNATKASQFFPTKKNNEKLLFFP